MQIQPKFDCKSNSAVSISEELNIPFWHNKKVTSLSSSLALLHGRTQTCSLSSVGWLGQAREGWSSFRYALHLQKVCTSFPQIVRNQAIHRWPPQAGWCCQQLAVPHHGQDQRHSAKALSCRSAWIQTDLISSSDRAAFSTWPEVFIDKNNMLVFPWHSC